MTLPWPQFGIYQSYKITVQRSPTLITYLLDNFLGRTSLLASDFLFPFLYFSYDENAALLRRHTNSPIHVRPAVRAKLNRALAQIIRNQDLEGQSTLRPEQDKAGNNQLGEETGEKKSHGINDLARHSLDWQLLSDVEQDELSGSGGTSTSFEETTSKNSNSENR